MCAKAAGWVRGWRIRNHYIASIKGGAMAIALNSQKPVGENTASVDRFLQDQNTVAVTAKGGVPFTNIFLS